MTESLQFSQSGRSQEEEVHVTLPCAPDHFAEFIAGLLGRPQTITRHFEFPFDIAVDELESLHHLLAQRITQQNEATLVQFVAVIYYHDKSSVRITSYEDFRAYNEVRPLRSIAVMLSWTFLIRFQDRRQPEKQEINIRFFTREARDTHSRYFNYRHSPLYLLDETSGLIDVYINYTARTWANDIDHLIKGYIESLEVQENRILRFLLRRQGLLGFLIGIMIFVAGMFALVEYTAYTDYAMIQKIEDVESDGALTTKEAILDVFKIIVSSSRNAHASVILFATIAGSMTLGVAAAAMADLLRRPSFITITAEAKKRAEKTKVRFRRAVAAYLLMLSVDVLVGLGVAIIATQLI